MRDTYERLARDLATVYETDDAEALERLGRYFDRIVSFESVRALLRRHLEVSRRAEAGGQTRLELDEARDLIVRQAGFSNWAAFLDSLPRCTRKG